MDIGNRNQKFPAGAKFLVGRHERNGSPRKKTPQPEEAEASFRHQVFDTRFPIQNR